MLTSSPSLPRSAATPFPFPLPLPLPSPSPPHSPLKCKPPALSVFTTGRHLPLGSFAALSPPLPLAPPPSRPSLSALLVSLALLQDVEDLSGRLGIDALLSDDKKAFSLSLPKFDPDDFGRKLKEGEGRTQWFSFGEGRTQWFRV